MIEVLKGTGIDKFTTGQKLSSQSLNDINTTVNNLVRAVNTLLRSTVNINSEESDYKSTYTLEEAITLVPILRRNPGVKIAFKETETDWTEYIYKGEDIKEESWFDTNNWALNTADVIDGGIW